MTQILIGYNIYNTTQDKITFSQCKFLLENSGNVCRQLSFFYFQSENHLIKKLQNKKNIFISGLNSKHTNHQPSTMVDLRGLPPAIALPAQNFLNSMQFLEHLAKLITKEPTERWRHREVSNSIQSCSTDFS